MTFVSMFCFSYREICNVILTWDQIGFGIRSFVKELSIKKTSIYTLLYGTCSLI